MKEIKEKILFDDLMKIDIRIGKIIEIEAIPKTDKLLKLKVSFSENEKEPFELQVVSAIAEEFYIDDLLNKRFPFVMNLDPIKIRGVESQAMILLCENSGGHLTKINDAYEGYIVI